MFDTSAGNFSFSGNKTEILTEGTVVTLMCDAGLTSLQGVDTVVCSVEGKWIPITPGCECKHRNMSYAVVV